MLADVFIYKFVNPVSLENVEPKEIVIVLQLTWYIKLTQLEPVYELKQSFQKIMYEIRLC